MVRLLSVHGPNGSAISHNPRASKKSAMADALCLLDLPAEILCYIVNLLDHPKDVAACTVASAALAYASPLDVATSYYHGRSEAALAASLPLSIARVLFERWGITPECRHIPAAAVGGHVDVVRWVCCHTKTSGSLVQSWTTARAPTSARQCTYRPGRDSATYRSAGLRECAPFDPTSGSDSSPPGSPLLGRSLRQEVAIAHNDDLMSSFGSGSPPTQRRRPQRHTPDASATTSDRSPNGEDQPLTRRRRQSASIFDSSSSSSSEDHNNQSPQIDRLEAPWGAHAAANHTGNSDSRPPRRRRRQSASILDSSSSSSSSEDEHEAPARGRIPSLTSHDSDSNSRSDLSSNTDVEALRLSVQADIADRKRRTALATAGTSSESTLPCMTPRSWHRRRTSPKPLGEPTRTIRVNGGHETAWCLFQAVGEAARLGHVDVLRHLTVSCPLTETPSSLLDEHIVIEAARRGTLATVAYAHDRWSQSRPLKSERPCRCPKQIAEAALAAGQRDLLRWMRTVGCSAFPCDMQSLTCAVADGNDVLVEAITDALASDVYLASADAIRPFSCWIEPRMLREAAVRGHVRALAIAHARGFAPFTAALLAAAAAEGHLDILRWAAGETVSGVEPCFAPLERLPWDDPMVTWYAAGQLVPNMGVLDWLAARPETRRHFDVVMAQTLVARGCSLAALWMHDSGLVPVSSWDSLEAEIQAGAHSIEAFIDRGAACSPRVMAAALMASGRDTGPIALLCQRYGHADLRGAIRLHVHAADTAAIRWVHDNVPEVSVAHILRADRANPFKHMSEKKSTRHQGDRSWGTSE